MHPQLFDPDTLEPSLAVTAPDNWIINPEELAATITAWATETIN